MIDKKHLEENIISSLGLQALSDEKKVALLDKMAEVIQKRLTLRVIEDMNENDKQEFEKILDKEPKEVADFLHRVFPNFLEMIQEEVVKLKGELAQNFEKTQE